LRKGSGRGGGRGEDGVQAGGAGLWLERGGGSKRLRGSGGNWDEGKGGSVRRAKRGCRKWGGRGDIVKKRGGWRRRRVKKVADNGK